MSRMHPVGCLWLNITLLISLVGILGPVALPSSQTETSALITPTDINYMFELENDEVTYSHKETLSCENILAGELIVDSSFVASSSGLSLVPCTGQVSKCSVASRLIGL